MSHGSRVAIFVLIIVLNFRFWRMKTASEHLSCCGNVTFVNCILYIKEVAVWNVSFESCPVMCNLPIRQRDLYSCTIHIFHFVFNFILPIHNFLPTKPILLTKIQYVDISISDPWCIWTFEWMNVSIWKQNSKPLWNWMSNCQISF